jgi:signal peptide peptidase SppA
MIDITQYGDIWAIEPDRAMSLLSYIRSVGAEAHIRHMQANKEHIKAELAYAAGDSGTPANTSGSVTVIPIMGTMMKQASSFSDNASTVRIRRQIQNAVRSGDIQSIVLHIDSPGGTVAGTQDLASEVKKANAKKPVFAFIEDMGASAAYWVASQATKVYAANDTTLIGSIGAFFGVYDMSKWAENNGVKPVLFTTGKYKTIFPGQEITQEQIDYLQSRVEQMQAHFSEAVSGGRSLSAAELKTVTDGKVYLAGEATTLKLADGIKSFADVVAEAEAAKSPGNRVTGKAAAMPRENMATLPQLKAAVPGASNDFYVSQLEKEATVEEAVRAHIGFETSRLEAVKTKLDDREKAIVDRETKVTERETAVEAREKALESIKGGAKPLDQSGSSEERPSSAFESASETKVKALTKERMAAHTDEAEAVARIRVLRDNPELRSALIKEANAGHHPRNGLMID